LNIGVVFMDLFGGIDVGHQSVKVIILDDESQVRGKLSLVTGDEAEIASRKALEIVLQNSGHHHHALTYLIATGVGKDWVKLSTKQASEVRCHALGAYYLHPSARIVINLGAETYRAMKLDEKGLVREFVENDKCAAGSGIFLDEMSAALEVTPEEAGHLCLNAKRREKISSLCVVFGESEVVSAVHRGVPKDEILAGIHESIAERAGMLAIRLRPEPDVVLTGGLANNPCIVRIMEEKLGLPLIIAEEPHLVGALGAALLAQKSCLKS
jgi:predicted CoA-substrate-specific enzyme activase